MQIYLKYLLVVKYVVIIFLINNGVGFTAGIRKTIILDLFARISYEIDVCTVKTEIDYDINNSYETYNHNIASGIGYPFIIGEGHAVIIEVGEIYTSWTMYYFNEHAGIAGVYPAYKTKESISNNNFIPFIRIGWLAKIGIEFEYRFGDNKNVPSSYAIFILLAIN